MNFVEPIRDAGKIEDMKRLLLQQSKRNYFLFVMGINTGLRISDLLPLRVRDVKGKSHLTINEKKTKKRKKFKLNADLRQEIAEYVIGKDLDEFLFASSKRSLPITRTRSYQILSSTATKLGLTEIGCHTMRKTFGYHFYQRTRDIATLQMILNHSHPQITLRYIGINQDLMDDAVDRFSL
ncbi:tyrosine-type recombinase/integrase [Brevibacillus centrosporus]|uniref:tyrosine-type recombinase/integrase n=1 Tax=Brevibacillus centrosporus TaxID=54910 RepID=UPI002E1C47D2|nr:tyrosine-type recombinase/integrase [Brevibacillus centrosporus]MED1954642.1 tyrosine-type recombinase/integrase [Brevibacillus centrosporus]